MSAFQALTSESRRRCRARGCRSGRRTLCAPCPRRRGCRRRCGCRSRGCPLRRRAAFGECALRAELDLELAGEELPLELDVLADVAGDHLFDLMGFEEQAETEVVDAGVVAGDGEIFYAAVAQGQDECFGDATEPEASDSEQHSVVNRPANAAFASG